MEGVKKRGRSDERRRLIFLNGFDVNNRELTWHPLHLSRLSTTRHDQVPQNSRKHLVSRACTRPNHQPDSGNQVAKGAPLVVLEAMKMEQTITAPSAGKIDRVLCEVGEQVREGAELLVFVDQ